MVYRMNLGYDCGTSSSGARKACKNCSCGLAQELEQEEHAAAKTNLKSSCGSVRINANALIAEPFSLL